MTAVHAVLRTLPVIPLPITRTRVEQSKVPGMGRRATRWTFDVRKWDLLFHEEVRFLDRPDNAWRPAYKYLTFAVSEWKTGVSAVYYDGEHCGLHLGFFHVYWSGT